jgi:hypothetical protein
VGFLSGTRNALRRRGPLLTMLPGARWKLLGLGRGVLRRPSPKKRRPYQVLDRAQPTSPAAVGWCFVRAGLDLSDAGETRLAAIPGLTPSRGWCSIAPWLDGQGMRRLECDRRVGTWR